MTKKVDLNENTIDFFTICICTYKRPHLLKLLLDDISNQSVQPDCVIIVDGYPKSGEVLQSLTERKFHSRWRVFYIPSNHGNLSYQRYLGWRTAKLYGSDILLYLDDDLRIFQTDAVEKTLAPIIVKTGDVCGVTGIIDFGDHAKFGKNEVLADRVQISKGKRLLLVRWLGASRRESPGGLSPSGHRLIPVDHGREYEFVEWLRGGVMAYKMNALTQGCFSEDLFALDHIRCGLGEDTFLSRRVGIKGALLMAFGAHFQHPHDDLPQAYPTQAFKFGHATAYSRRLLNDNYRGFDPPQFSDRLALVKSYLGTSCLNWWRALAAPKKHRFAYAWGYTLGAFRGLIQKPTASNLTPHISWWQDADEALRHTIIIQEGSDG